MARPWFKATHLTAQGMLQRRQLEAFLLAFDSNLALIVGQQTTLGKNNAADAHECDMVSKNRSVGYLYFGNGNFKSVLHHAALIGDAALRATVTAAHDENTYTCTPPGSVFRIALDRDEDGMEDKPRQR